MQTEIDHFLTEQNNLLSEQNSLLIQQINSLKTILSEYSEVEQSLKTQLKQQQTLISAQQSEIAKIEQGSFSEQLQQAFQENLKIQLSQQLTKSLSQLDLKIIVSNLVTANLEPIQTTISTQQSDIERALSKILQLKVPSDFYEDLQMQSKQINMLG
ncbi:hypothetical protein, partial [Acinetobacter sp. YH16056]|uniref:hypothetical protein n=1 Tax=Acinetobacter sp. YH16056 TaxID=2601194 RepID=UPI0015D1A8E4